MNLNEEALSKETIERYLNVPHVWLVTADAALSTAPFDERITLINSVLKPGFARLSRQLPYGP